MTPTWLVVGLSRRQYSGGTIRAGLIYSDLCAREPVIAIRGRRVSDGLREVIRRPAVIRGPIRVATSRMLSSRTVKIASRLFDMSVIDIHDHAVLQAAALGLPQSAAVAAKSQHDLDVAIDSFGVLIAQTESFASLAGLPPDRTLIIPNGTDPGRFRWVPPPQTPVVGLVSGAAPGRGIEVLIDAVRDARDVVPELTLRMALAVTDPGSGDYLRDLRRKSASEPWIEVVSLSYDEVPGFLEGVSITAVPHPAAEYWDAIVPVKLFDSMMSGRPLVVTPRRETSSIVRTYQAGEVAAGDTPGDLAEAIVRLVDDPQRAASLGMNAREAAATHFAWPVLSARITDRLVSRPTEVHETGA